MPQVSLIKLTYSIHLPLEIFGRTYTAEVYGDNDPKPVKSVGTIYKVKDCGIAEIWFDSYRNVIDWHDFGSAASIWGYDTEGSRLLLKSKLLEAFKGYYSNKARKYENLLSLVQEVDRSTTKITIK